VTRVLLVHQPTGGGVARHVADLARGLTVRGHEAIVCGPSPPDGLKGIAHEPLSMQRAVSPAADLSALAAFAQIVRRVRPDVVHAHSSKAGAIARLGRLAHPRIPVIYTPHGYAFAGHFSSVVERATYREIERVLSPLASRVVCVCEAEARLACTVCRAGRVAVVHNGVEMAEPGLVDPHMEALGREGPVICALTQLRPGKGLETLLDAMPEVLTHHPSAQLAIVGEGPDLQALQARASMRGIPDAINFLGWRADTLGMLRGATIFAHPSWAESFPYVILEAMSAALPIVASDVGGIGEALVDGESGLLVEPADSSALAGALRDLLGDPERQTRIGRAARSRVERCFTQASMIEGTIDVYDKVLS
jgi:glycosyltransferase involved in cell wall biosynthesis